MKIITAGDATYKELVAGAVAMNKKVGYDTLVYDIGGLGFGKPFDISEDLEMIRTSKRTLYTGKTVQKGSFKPKVILDALESFPNEKAFAWIDSDAFCIKEIHYIMYRKVFDIAVTMRRKGEHAGTPFPMWDQYINSGVVLINNSEHVREFIRQWIARVPTTEALSDQEALNYLCDAPLLQEPGKVYNVNGYKILNLTTDEYNFYYFPEEPHPDTKVLHFKGVKEHTMEYFHKYYKKYSSIPTKSTQGVGG